MADAHASRAHAKLSPSSAYRWFACPGSVRLSEGIPNKSSVFADEGTAAHTLAQVCLEQSCDADLYIGAFVAIDSGKISGKETPRSFEVTDEMAESVQVYLDTVREFMAVPGAEYEFEARLDLQHIPGMAFGTGDFICYNEKTKRLAIVDLKYGRGVAVDAEENEQLLVYALGVAKRFHNRGLDQVDMVIVQPRCPHPAGAVRTYTIDALDLVEFRFRLEEAAKATMADDAALVPGEHCRFCPASVTCPALRQHVVATAEVEFGEEPPKVDDLTPDRMGEILTQAETIEGWIKRVKERAHAMALEGNCPPRFKLVASTSHRKFKDDVTPGALAIELDVAVDDVLTAPKLKSPAQVEKLIGKKRAGEIADFVFKPRGKIILAPDSDPREAVKPDAETEFAA